MNSEGPTDVVILYSGKIKFIDNIGGWGTMLLPIEIHLERVRGRCVIGNLQMKVRNSTSQSRLCSCSEYYFYLHIVMHMNYFPDSTGRNAA